MTPEQQLALDEQFTAYRTDDPYASYSLAGIPETDTFAQPEHGPATVTTGTDTAAAGYDQVAEGDTATVRSSMYSAPDAQFFAIDPSGMAALHTVDEDVGDEAQQPPAAHQPSTAMAPTYGPGTDFGNYQQPAYLGSDQSPTGEVPIPIMSATFDPGMVFQRYDPPSGDRQSGYSSWTLNDQSGDGDGYSVSRMTSTQSRRH